MKRKIVKIDEEKCNGCGLCADACHEGAIEIINGKAKLVSESYCDGLGACLPHCPVDAISIEERDADAFDEEYALEYQQKKQNDQQHAEKKEDKPLACGCPGTQSRPIKREKAAQSCTPETGEKASQLSPWPCQIKLVPVNAPCFNGASLLIAADCTAYAYAGLHERFMRGKMALIGCPKLDDVDYSEKLTAILSQNDIRSITVLRMEVPCCGGMVNAVKRAIQASGVVIPWHVVTISVDGKIIEE
jgi:ferredoxin